MKKTNKLFALILAVVMIASLAACSGKPAAPNGAPNANAAVEPTAAELSNKLDLATTEFKKAQPFSEGLAWVVYMDCSTLINKEGEIIYQGDDQYSYCSPVSDGACYYSSSKGGAIIDKDGNVLYQTADGEKILGYGDGKYLVYRLVTGFDKHDGSIGTIDKNGNETTEFVPVDEADNYTVLESSDRWNYLDDGLFYEADSEYPLVFDTTNGKFRNNVYRGGVWYFSIDENYKTENGKIWLYNGKGLTIFDMHAWEPVEEVNSSFEKEQQIVIASDRFGKTGMVDYVYYDLNGEKIADVSLYPDKVEERGEFTDAGCAYLLLSDNSGRYITYVNKNGEQQFEPLTVGTQYAVNGDYFAIGYGNQNVVVIRDYTGEEKFRVEGVGGVDTLGDDYIIFADKYYFFQ